MHFLAEVIETNEYSFPMANFSKAANGYQPVQDVLGYAPAHPATPMRTNAIENGCLERLQRDTCIECVINNWNVHQDVAYKVQ